jgi:hypothetical protein
LLSHGLDRESVKLAFDEFNDSITSFDE